MKKFLAISLIFIIGLILLNCGSSTIYVVINNSNFPIEVEYVITSNVNSLENTATKPYKTIISEWDKQFGRIEWKEVQQNEYEFNLQSKTCRIQLNPNEVLRINLEYYQNHEEEKFRVESLQLNGANGKITYQGERLYKQFETKDNYNYFISYK